MDPHLNIYAYTFDTHILIYALIIAVLLFFSGFFSKSETVFSSVSKAKLMTYIEENKKGARKALYLAENFERVLTVLLIGNNLVNIAISTLGLRIFLLIFNKDTSWIDLINTGVITLFVLIFGEILPKTNGKSNPEKNALMLSGILYVIVKILTPISYPFYRMSKNRTEKIEEDDSMSSSDLENIIDSMEEEGEIKESEADMLQKVLDLSEIDVKNIMTPRVDCITLDVNTPIDKVKECFFLNQYSRVPIYDGTIDHIIGVLFEKDFFKAIIKNPELKSIKSLIQKPLFVVGSMSADKLLSLLKTKNVHLAVVLDEYGGFDGVVTMEDTLEELVGEIFDEHDEVPFTFEKISDDKYLVSGDLEIENLYDLLDINTDHEYESTTIGGLIQDKLERLPMLNDTASIKIVSKILYDELDTEEGFEYKELIFVVKEILNNRITKLELTIKDSESLEE